MKVKKEIGAKKKMKGMDENGGAGGLEVVKLNEVVVVRDLVEKAGGREAQLQKLEQRRREILKGNSRHLSISVESFPKLPTHYW
uniref:Uncharacterized protein n=1 Tax=Cucumis melo TaxID=3656 RepID=A0A9I9DTP8_CUCME